jgi:putative glutathione S-transferase
VQATDAKGGFVRKVSGFPNWGTEDGATRPTGEAGFKVEVGRQHLYVVLTRPWASRTLMVRKLKGPSSQASPEAERRR